MRNHLPSRRVVGASIALALVLAGALLLSRAASVRGHSEPGVPSAADPTARARAVLDVDLRASPPVELVPSIPAARRDLRLPERLPYDAHRTRAAEDAASAGLGALLSCIGQSTGGWVAPRRVDLTFQRAGTGPDGEARFVVARATAPSTPSTDRTSACLVLLVGRALVIPAGAPGANAAAFVETVTLPLPSNG